MCVGTNASTNTNTLSSNALAKGEYDFFRVDGGSATPIIANEQFGPGTIDDMATAIVGKLGLPVGS